MSDPYQILGVERDASLLTIKMRYRALSKELHPDKTGNSAAATERFKAVQAAFETLSDPERREYFDQHGQDRPAGEPSLQSRSLALLSQVFHGLIRGDLGHSRDPEQRDMLASLRSIVRNLVEKSRGEVARLERAQQAVEGVMKRLKYKRSKGCPEESPLEAICRSQLAEIAEAVAQHRRDAEVADYALKILSQYTFDVKAGATRRSATDWGIILTPILGSRP